MTNEEITAAILKLEDFACMFQRDVEMYFVFLGLLNDDDDEFENIRRPEFTKRMSRLSEWMNEHADAETMMDFHYLRARCNDLYDLVDMMKHFEPPFKTQDAFAHFIEKERQELVNNIDNLFREVHGLTEKDNEQ